jgi:hypothetical protein
MNWQIGKHTPFHLEGELCPPLKHSFLLHNICLPFTYPLICHIFLTSIFFFTEVQYSHRHIFVAIKRKKVISINSLTIEQLETLLTDAKKIGTSLDFIRLVEGTIEFKIELKERENQFFRYIS